MAGILVVLIISWVIIFFSEKGSLLVLGVIPIKKRIKQFAFGFLFASLLCIGSQYFESILKSSSWMLNENMTARSAAHLFWWDFKSVLTEELIFRGVLLYLLITKLSANLGILISAIAFGIYHLFSYGLHGQLVPMFVVFTGTGLMGYAWALAYFKSSSIAMPLGLHYGWNSILNTVYSQGPLGEGIIIPTIGNDISDWFSLIDLWLVPLIILLFVAYIVPNENNGLTQMN